MKSVTGQKENKRVGEDKPERRWRICLIAGVGDKMPFVVGDELK